MYNRALSKPHSKCLFQLICFYWFRVFLENHPFKSPVISLPDVSTLGRKSISEHFPQCVAYRRAEFAPRAEFTLRTMFSTGESLGPWEWWETALRSEATTTVPITTAFRILPHPLRLRLRLHCKTNPLCLVQRSACLAHQNRTIAISSDFRVDRAKSPEISQKEWGFGPRNRNSKSQIDDFPSHPKTAVQHCFLSSWKLLAISGVRDGHRNRKSQRSLRFRCAKN